MMAGQYTLQQLQQLGLIGQDTLNEMFANSFGLSGIGDGYGAGNMRWQPNAVQEMGGEGGPYFTGLQAAPPSWMGGGSVIENESGVPTAYLPGVGEAFSQDAYNKANGYTFDWQKTGPRGGGALTVFDPNGQQAGQYQQQSDQTFWQGVLEAGALAAAGFGGVGLMGLGPLGGLLGGAGAGAAGAAEGAALGGAEAAGLAGAEGAFSTGAIADGLGGITAGFGASPEFLALTSGELAGAAGAGGMAGLGAAGGGSGGFATGMLGDGLGAISTGFGASPEFLAATGGAMEGAGALMGAGLGGSIGAAAPVLPGTATALTAGGGLLGGLGSLGSSIGDALKGNGGLVGNLLGTGAQLIGAGKAADAVGNAADKSNELLRYMYDTTRADNMPALNARNQSLTQATSLLANPSSITSDPGYQFGLSQGIKAYDNSGSAKGMRLSGQQAKALTQYGQDYGGTKLTESLNRLMAVAGGGQAGAGTIANAGSNYANAAASNIGSAGTANALVNASMGNNLAGGINNLTAYGIKKNWWEN